MHHEILRFAECVNLDLDEIVSVGSVIMLHALVVRSNIQVGGRMDLVLMVDSGFLGDV